MRKLRIALLIFSVVAIAVFAAFTIRDRMTSDYQAPEIRADSDTLQVTVSATDEDLMAGMTAEDNLDGDVTDTLVIESKGKFISKGTRRVNYAAFDNNKNVGTYSREVTYTDYTSPRFRLTAPLRFLDTDKDHDYLKNLRAEDCLDGDITRQIKLNTGEVTIVSDTIRDEVINLQVTNSGGDTTTLDLVARTEGRETYQQPAPALSDYVVYVHQGGSVDLRSYLSGIWTNGETTDFDETEFSADDVLISDGNLVLNTPGVYTVTYQLIRYGEDYLGSATMYVVVEE